MQIIELEQIREALASIDVVAAILGRADRVVADSISQCRVRGEISHALAAGVVTEAELVELGNVIAGEVPGRTSSEQITPT